MKYLPAAISSIGLAMVGCIYVFSEVLHKTKMISQSVMAENQYFAAFLGTYTGIAMIGSILALIITKFSKNRDWGKN